MQERYWDGSAWTNAYRPRSTPYVAQPGKVGAEAILIPVNISGWAMAAGYLGLLSIILVPAPLSLAIGLVALRDLNKRPHKRGRGRAIFGIVAGSLGTALLLIAIVAIALKN